MHDSFKLLRNNNETLIFEGFASSICNGIFCYWLPNKKAYLLTGASFPAKKQAFRSQNIFYIRKWLNQEMNQSSDVVFDVRTVTRSKASIGLVVTRVLPFKVEFINILSALCLDQLGDEIELLAKANNAFLKDAHFQWTPHLERGDDCDRIEKYIQISLFVEIGNCIKVQFYRFLLFLGIDFVDFVLRFKCLKYRALLELQLLQELLIRMLLILLASFHYFGIDPFKAWLGWQALGLLHSCLSFLSLSSFHRCQQSYMQASSQWRLIQQIKPYL